MKHRLLVSLVGLGLILIGLSACGNQKTVDHTSNSASGNYPVTISNYTKAEGATTWQPKEQLFTQTPEKVLANTRPAAELLLHLGLQERIAGVGATFGVADPEVAAEFEQLKDLGSSYISKEVALSVNPDMMYGRGNLFDNQDWGIGTVDALNEMGLPTYVLASSVNDATFASVYQDIENLGAIFDVLEAAEKFAAEIKERQTKLEAQVKDNDNQTFAYLHMSDPSQVNVYAANGEAFFNDMFSMIKLENVFKEQTGDVSEETLIETDPEVLIVGDWSSIDGSVSGQEVIEALYANPKLASMQAVKNKQIYAVDYNYLFGYGYQSLTGLEKLVQDMDK